jgi:hypothetical protein
MIANKKMPSYEKKETARRRFKSCLGGKLTVEFADGLVKLLDPLFVSVLLRENLRPDELQHGRFSHFSVDS